MKQPILLLVLLCFCWQSGTAQDPFFSSFHGNRSYFNPALTGYRGALSLDVKLKQQWNQLEDAAFYTKHFNLEESAPCGIFDWGLHYNLDREGAGLLETNEVGGKFAATIPTYVHPDVIHNLRVGANLKWAWKQIDFSNLTFSDQLDPKYGLVDVNGLANPTSFVSENGGATAAIFAPSIGLTYQILFRKGGFNPLVQVGGSLQNAYRLGAVFGNEESLLDKRTILPERYNLFAEAEFLIYENNRQFIGLAPLVMWQQQAGLSYFEVGTSLFWKRNLSVGLYYHFNERPDIGQNSNWFSLAFEVGKVMYKNQRFDLGITYSNNISGLRNSVGPLLEISISVHFAKSLACQLMNGDYSGPWGSRQKGCPPNVLYSPARNKLYRHIWYE